MVLSTGVGLSLLQAGALLMASAVIRQYCARRVSVGMVPAVLQSRIHLCNRLAPTMWLSAAVMLAVGALICLLASCYR